MINIWTEVLVGLAAMIGMMIQRSTGFGSALISMPIFCLVLGPFHGVLLTNALSVPVNSVVLMSTWRGLHLRRLTILVPAGLAAAIPGAWAAHALPKPYLLMFAGLVIVGLVVGLELSQHRNRESVHMGTRMRLLRTGAASGFLQAATATGGPPMAVFATRSRWPVSSFVPTMQSFNIIIGVFAIVLKGPPEFVLNKAVGLLACLLVGSILGAKLVKWLPENRLRALSVLLALAGGLAAFTKGLLSF